MIEFKTSTFCSIGDCVEVGRGPRGWTMRDTKDRRVELTFDDEDWAAFVVKIKRGEFDRA